MSAYLIVETDIHDPERYERYKQASPGAIAASAKAPHRLHGS